MSIFNVLTMLGGLALFLYGMDLMGNGLTRLSGNRLEQILQKLTTNKYKAVLLGMAVTALIQSSSGTTVMVVGLVNSGIMKLSQAVGVIMGANVGTTVTSWILSLTGLQGDNVFVKLLTPDAFSPVLALIGIIIMMSTKRSSRRNLAEILIGFAILMFGMSTMSGALKPLANMPSFTQLFTYFSNPILGLLMGALLTALIQSSSASVGILQALCATGSVSYGAAFPIIMGQNIGTCITALLSSIGANKNARRAACVHLSFNVIGTTLFMVVFYIVDAFVHFHFLSEAASVFGIAIVHSCFNVLATLVLLPFSRGLERLACLIIRDKDTEFDGEEKAFKLLDARFLDNPTFAVDQAHAVLVKMSELCRDAIVKAIDLIGNYSDEGFKEVELLENRIDRYEDRISSYLVRISGKEMLRRDSRHLTIMLSCVDDFERISDHAINVAIHAQQQAESGGKYSDQAQRELSVYTRAIQEIMELAVEVYRDMDRERATQIEPLEETIDSINKHLAARHIERLRGGRCTIELGLSFADILNNLERVADHCSNVAVNIIEINANSFDRHEYLTRHRQHSSFDVQYRAYRAKYRLPEAEQAPVREI